MSLVTLGQRPPAGETPASMLLDCHARIRAFAELAVKLAEADAADCDVADAALRVHRYFTVALPLHVADEEKSIAPRLLGHAPIVGDALRVMEHEHAEHQLVLERLIPQWKALQEDPRLRRDSLLDARLLQIALEKHLAAEERFVIPALACLSASEARAIVVEMRQRRTYPGDKVTSSQPRSSG